MPPDTTISSERDFIPQSPRFFRELERDPLLSPVTKNRLVDRVLRDELDLEKNLNEIRRQRQALDAGAIRLETVRLQNQNLSLEFENRKRAIESTRNLKDRIHEIATDPALGPTERRQLLYELQVENADVAEYSPGFGDMFRAGERLADPVGTAEERLDLYRQRMLDEQRERGRKEVEDAIRDARRKDEEKRKAFYKHQKEAFDDDVKAIESLLEPPGLSTGSGEDYNFKTPRARESVTQILERYDPEFAEKLKSSQPSNSEFVFQVRTKIRAIESELRKHGAESITGVSSSGPDKAVDPVNLFTPPPDKK